ncbi:MAG: 3-deoxy-manno-octulosonate cytidylyltransferase [Gammaproteobacteria bacterium]
MHEPFHVIIPARLGSTRLPAKLLADIGGQPAISYTWKSACASGAAQVLIAACGSELADVAQGFGADTCLTDPELPSGTDRCLAACQHLPLHDHSIIVNVQGDELLMPPTAIAAVGQALSESNCDIATLAQPISVAESQLPQRVKVVTALNGQALYFSRAAIPWDAAAGQISRQAQHHLGIYAYRLQTLKKFADLPPSALEQTEKLEQLRALEQGMSIHVASSPQHVPPGLDTAEDLERIRGVLAP